MRLRTIAELYSRPQAQLRDYLRDKPFEPADHLHYILSWLQQDGPGSLEFSARTGLGEDDLWRLIDQGVTPETQPLWDRLRGGLNRQDIDAIITDQLQSGGPQEVPTWGHADYSGIHRRHQWLVHFTADAEAIKRQGFRHGMDDLTRLGLTTYIGMDQKPGGYNFAYEAQSRSAAQKAQSRQYGAEAVLFRTAGVRIYHYGDDEQQVVFWGPDVSPDQLILLTRDGSDWLVPSRSGGRDLFRGGFPEAVAWVLQNHHQYRRLLF